jgi:hypothetical protein
MADRTALDSSLKFLLEEKGVPDAVQDLIARAGTLTMALFALIEDTRAGLRTMMKDEWGMDPATDPAHRVSQATVIDAWETACIRLVKEREETAKAHATRLPRQMTGTELLAMRRAFENRHRVLEDDHAPSDSLVERRIEEIEQGEYKAEPLTMITTKGDDDVQQLGAEVERSGIIKVTRGTKDIPMPEGSEALRKRLMVWGIAWIYAALRHVSRTQLRSMHPDVVHEYSDFLLGDSIYGLVAKDSDDNVISRPSWKQLLHYEFEIRKKVAKLMNQGMGLVDALRQSVVDPTLKERHFVTPVAISSMSMRQPRESVARDSSRSSRVEKVHSNGNFNKKKGNGGSGGGGGKNRGKGGGKGKKGVPPNWKTHTPDKRPICFAYNSIYDKCDKSKCGFVHCCRICFGNHPAHAHQDKNEEITN